ncbi:hypothetical protein AB0F77_01470 [Streptomyces sp. NPDC026672]|uniref:hypothetical protein n=1 Tax=unclassified Streptomyces TaxID=2593676 RepID=UPI003404D5CC
MNVKSFAKAGAVFGALSLGLGVLAAPASADSTGPGILAGVGSDTTQYVVSALASGSTVVDAGGAKLLQSWDAIPPSGTADNITTKPTGNCTFARSTVNGSSNGINKLIAEIDNTATADCVDFARSSRGPATTGTKLTFVPFAKDAVTFASRLGSTAPTNLTQAQLYKLYTCAADRPAGIKPLLPQAGSGTRSFWLQYLGNTPAPVNPNPGTPITPGSCVNEGLAEAPQEHDGTALTANDQVMPYSVAQWLAQGKGFSDVPNRRGQSRLRSIDNVSPTTGTGSATALNATFPAAREVYNVVSTARLGESTITEAFVGSTADVCSAASLAVIKNYGFGDLADDGRSDTNCGDTALKGNS